MSFRRSFRSHTVFGRRVFSVTHSFSVTHFSVTDSVRSQDFRSQTVFGVLSVTDSLRSQSLVGHRQVLVRDSFVAHTMRFDDRHGGRDIVSCGAHDC